MSNEAELDLKIRNHIAKAVSGTTTEKDWEDYQHTIAARSRLMRPEPGRRVQAMKAKR